MQKLFPLGDYLNIEERKRFGVLDKQSLSQNHFLIKAVYAKEKRCPKKGEWYLSGARVHAYRAPNDLTSIYHIAKLVKTEMVQFERIIG